MDLAVADGKVVNILLGKGNGSFGLPAALNAGRLISSVATGDFNGDHAADLVMADLAHKR